MKQLVVFQCDLQVTIHEGLMETQMELLETIGSFVDHFQSEMTNLSPPQMHALLDHLQTRRGGGQVLLDAIQRVIPAEWPFPATPRLLRFLTRPPDQHSKGFNSFVSF